MAESLLDGRRMSNVAQVRAAVARSRVAWACGDHSYGQSQDSYSSGVPARARAGLTELSDQLSLAYTPAYAPCCQSHRVEVRTSHAVLSRIIITGATLRRCWQMPERTLRRSPIPLMSCFVISAVLLRLTSVLPSHRSVPYDQLESIELTEVTGCVNFSIQ